MCEYHWLEVDEEAISFAQGYYDNFVRLTLDAISSGQDVAVASGTDEMVLSDHVTMKVAN